MAKKKLIQPTEISTVKHCTVIQVQQLGQSYISSKLSGIARVSIVCCGIHSDEWVS